jgi:hypothetical protein
MTYRRRSRVQRVGLALRQCIQRPARVEVAEEQVLVPAVPPRQTTMAAAASSGYEFKCNSFAELPK